MSRVALMLVAFAILGGCAKSPGVSVEQVHEQRTVPRRGQYQRVFPPRCPEIPAAEYPDVDPDRRPETVAVRVDLTIDPRGEAIRIEAEVLEGPEVSDLFVDAAVRAAANLRCQPALRPPRPGSGEVAPQPVAYNSSLIYRFHRDRMQAEGSF